jgi:hypothetical protein
MNTPVGLFHQRNSLSRDQSKCVLHQHQPGSHEFLTDGFASLLIQMKWKRKSLFLTFLASTLGMRYDVMFCNFSVI